MKLKKPKHPLRFLINRIKILANQTLKNLFSIYSNNYIFVYMRIGVICVSIQLAKYLVHQFVEVLQVPTRSDFEL